MKLSNALLALSTIGGGLALRHRRDDGAAQASNGIDTVPKRFIIELEKGASVDALSKEIASRKGAKVLKVFDTDVFKGVSVEAEEDNIDTLHAMQAVSKAWKSNKIKLAPHIPTQSFSDDASASIYTVHNWTGVDRLHDAGIKGKGAVVAIVDTGIWYPHPDLGGGIGPGFKVTGGYDLVGQGSWPYDDSPKEPDDDPLDQLGHGTHVAGIVAAKGDQFVGVAPEATLLSYKVFGALDGTDEDTLIEAFLMAYEANADIITCSVGGDEGWADSAWPMVASRLVEQGVVVTIAAGNSGYEGPVFSSNGAAGEFVLAVASVEASTLVSPGFYGTFSLDGQSNTTEVAYIPGWDVAFPASIVDWEFVPLSLDINVEADACEPLPADTPDLSQVIPLIRRGGCDFDVKQANLEAFGAQYIMFYNNDQWRDTPWVWEQSSSILGMVDKTAGEAMIATIKAGGNVTGDFALDPSSHYFGMYNSAGGKANMFTSWGSLNDLTLKPDIAAPGGDIFSTYMNDEYAVLSGTSMATPYIAGVAALYIGQYGGRSTHGPDFAKQLAMRIMSSGRSVPWWDGLDELKDFGFWAPPIQVGTGLVDATRVLNYETSLSFSKFSLNDTHHFSRYHEVDVTNNGNETISYRFELQDAAGFTFWIPYDPEVANTPRFKMYWSDEMIPEKLVPDVSFPSGTFSVKPGQTKTAKFSFKYPNYPAGLENLPLYSGKILVVSSKGEEMSIPYFGAGSDLKDLMAKHNFRHEAGWPQVTSGLFWPPFTIDERSNYTFNLTVYSQDFPHLESRTNWAVRELRWDIFEGDWVERDWKYPPVVGQAGYVGSVASWALADQGYYYFDPATDNENLTISFPLRNLPRTALDSYNMRHWWMGKLANGSQIGLGDYVMRYATLAPFGVPEHSDNWDTYTHTFSVLPLVECEVC